MTIKTQDTEVRHPDFADLNERGGLRRTENDLHPDLSHALEYAVDAGRRRPQGLDGEDQGAADRQAGCSGHRPSETVAIRIDYYEANADRMHYDF